jgi:hypothetical protein
MGLIRISATLLLVAVCATALSGQGRKGAIPSAAPPYFLLFVRQDCLPGRGGELEKLESTLSRESDRLGAPNLWIKLQALTGSPETFLLSPLDSFEHWEQIRTAQGQFYAAHPDLLKLQAGIDRLVGDKRTIFATRRDDLGYQADNIDLSEARYMRIVELHLFPGREDDFVEDLHILAEAYTKLQSDVPWMVYEGNAGTSAPTFFIFLPMHSLAQNDDLFSWQQALPSAEGDEAAERVKQIARESFASSESNVYEVRPDLSHVSKEFADGDPDFWRTGTAPDSNPEVKENTRPTGKRTSVKPSPQ